MLRKSSILMLLGCLFYTPLSGQVELNIKVKASATTLAEYLAVSAQDPANITQKQSPFPYLEKLTRVSSYAVNKAPSSNTNRLSRCFTLQFHGYSSSEIINRLTSSGQFEFVEENRQRSLHSFHQVAQIPNDPSVSVQWYHNYIKTFQAWDSTKGKAAIKIGILDTGLDYEHPEFEGQSAINPAEDRNGNGSFEPWPDTVIIHGLNGDWDGIDQDGNGYIDDVIGYDFTDQPRSPFGGDYLNEDANPLDDNNHGTLVAGIIGAKADNGYGGAGIAPECKLVTLRAFSAAGIGEDDDIARAIIYAADNGIQILNFSFGDIYPSQLMHEAIRYAAQKGVIMIASAGNGTGDNLHYPSGFEEVISVSASDVNPGTQNEFLWPLSSYGLTVTLAAPGSGIYTTKVRDTSGNNGFDYFSGTSTAAPMVTGAVALLFSLKGACSIQQVRGLLAASAEDISTPGWDHFTGAGRLDIFSLLQQVGAPHIEIISPKHDGGTTEDSIAVVVTAFDPLLQEVELAWQAGTEGNGSWNTLVTGLTQQFWQDTIHFWQFSGLPDGEYTLRLIIHRRNGSQVEDRIRYLIDRSPPNISLQQSGEAWDNDILKWLLVYRNSDPGKTQLHYRNVGDANFKVLTADRMTKNGYFLLGTEAIKAGAIAYYISCTNASGLTGQTALDTFAYQPQYISTSGYDTLGFSLPMGYYLPTPTDFDQDGLPEVVLNQYSSTLAFGKLMTYEYNAGNFVAVDSLTFNPVLIPKAIADSDGDGLEELLCSVNDSLYLVEQLSSNTYPLVIQYENLGNGFFAAGLEDPDADGDIELIAKDFKDYYIFENQANNFILSETLPDISPDYQGSIAPRYLEGDFDGDGSREIVYGDFDGDFLIYENNGNGYSLIFQDTTALQKAGAYLAQGDFNGNGREEIFVAAHSLLLRNEEDFEYEAPFWLLRIFERSADNTFDEAWRTYLFDVDAENFNAVTAGNTNASSSEEIIFTSFPRTYLIAYDGNTYQMEWFHYGDICTHHLIGDFNNNGINEFALGRGDKALFYEADVNYSGPEVPLGLSGEVIDSQSTALKWQANNTAATYLIWRGEATNINTVTISLIDSSSTPEYINQNLQAGQTYLYVVQSKNPALTPAVSGFSNAVILTPHENCRLDSAIALDESTVQAFFSQPVTGRVEDQSRFLLDRIASPVAIASGGGSTNSLILHFDTALTPGIHQLEVDAQFLDKKLGRIDTLFASVNFTYTADSSQKLFLSSWEAITAKKAILYFNSPVTASALSRENYEVLPYGTLMEVDWADASNLAVELTLQEVAFGALGYPLSIVVTEVMAENGAIISEKKGNVATFLTSEASLDKVFVYPNPVLPQDYFGGLRFANLSRQAIIEVYNVSGRFVARLEETDGDGGYTWNMQDLSGKRVVPGTYIFTVKNEEGDEFTGQFTILE